MKNQEIVYIDVEGDDVIIQSRNNHYHDTVENFIKDEGHSVLSYIRRLDICKDTGLKMLNGAVLGENTIMGKEVTAYADALILAVDALKEAQEKRQNPKPELTPEEKENNERQDEINEAKQYLSETDYAVIKCMELGLDLDTEYPGLREKRQAKRDLINENERKLKES